jgi:nucleoside-diphosphate-sugar epimerase
LDLRVGEQLDEALKALGAEIVFHLAGPAIGTPDRDLVMPMFEENAVGTVRLLAAASQVGCRRFVLVSSAEVAQASAGSPPHSPYVAAKLVGELYGRMFHRLYGLPLVCVRPVVTYGPRQEPTKLIPYAIGTLLRGERPSFTSGNRVCDVVFVADVVRGLLLAGIGPDASLGRPIDLGTGRGVTIRELIGKVAALMESAVEPVFGVLPDRPDEPALVADPAPSWSLLGWAPRWSLDDGLAQTILWYQQQRARGSMAR